MWGKSKRSSHGPETSVASKPSRVFKILKPELLKNVFCWGG